MRVLSAIALGATLLGAGSAVMPRGVASAQTAVQSGPQYVVGVSGMT